MIRYFLLFMHVLGTAYLAAPDSEHTKVLFRFPLNLSRGLTPQTYVMMSSVFITFVMMSYALMHITQEDMKKYRNFIKWNFLVHVYYMVEFLLNYSSFGFTIFGLTLTSQVIVVQLLAIIILNEDGITYRCYCNFLRSVDRIPFVKKSYPLYPDLVYQ